MEPIIITMTNKEARRYEVINNLIAQKINGTDAGKLLELSVRQIKRLKAKVIKEGIKGIIHKLRGKRSNNKTADALLEEIKKIIQKNYSDFGPTLTMEKLKEAHQINLGVTTIRNLMITLNYETNFTN